MHFSRIANILALSTILSSPAISQTQKPPAISHDPQNNEMKLDWQSSRNRTFFLQSSVDLEKWNYEGTLDFGAGSHQRQLQPDSPKRFFRLRYSDQPVATEEEARTADFDLDGLSNQAELEDNRTDPLGADTDADGLPDGWEIAHAINPLDNGSIDPANGPDGEFKGGRALRSRTPDAQAAPTGVTNAAAYGAGVRADSAATLDDKDGDGIPNAIDAGPLSRCINWQGSPTKPKLIFVGLDGYSEPAHGWVMSCNNRGDALASKALYWDGVWCPLAQIAVEPPHYLPIKIRVDGRLHDAYVKYQPNPSSVADDGRIVGSATVHLEEIQEEVRTNIWKSYQPGPVRLAFIWDSWATPPRLLAHAPGSVLEGNSWEEYAQISGDGVITITRKAAPTNPLNKSVCLLRFGPDGASSQIGPFPELIATRVGDQGFQAFNIGQPNAFSWHPEAASPVSLLADARFATPNPRTSIYPGIEPLYLGIAPNGAHAISFWGKTLLRHENQWQEATELNGAKMVTRKGLALYFSYPDPVKVWHGGAWFPLKDCVVNKDFSNLHASSYNSTEDGRILLNHSGPNSPSGSGYLFPVEVVELSPKVRDEEGNDIAGSEHPSHGRPLTPFVEVNPVADRIAHRELKVRIGKPLKGKTVTWTLDAVPDVTPAAIRGQWTHSATHPDRFEASVTYGTNGFTRLSQASGRTTVADDGFTAIRVNVPPVGFNQVRIRIQIEDIATPIDLIDMEVPGVVVIDPGHGGTTNEPGSNWNNATSPSGAQEKAMALDYGLALRDSLRAIRNSDRLNLRIFMTRETDINRPGFFRAARARDNGADIIHIIHFNAASTPKARGTLEVYRETHNVFPQQDTILSEGIITRMVAAITPFDTGANHRARVAYEAAVASDENNGNTSAYCPIRTAYIEVEFIDFGDHTATSDDDLVDILLNTGPNATAVRTAIANAMRDGILHDLRNHQPQP